MKLRDKRGSLRKLWNRSEFFSKQKEMEMDEEGLMNLDVGGFPDPGSVQKKKGKKGKKKKRKRDTPEKANNMQLILDEIDKQE
jgi:hypothetical protein